MYLTMSVARFIWGEGVVDPSDPHRESALSQLAKAEVSLTLTSKFELLEGDDKDLKTLMTKLVWLCKNLTCLICWNYQQSS